MKPSICHVALVTCLFALMVSGVYCRPPSMRCRCISAVSACRRDDIEKLETLSAGPHCPRDQVIVTLKHGRKRCLEPKSPEVKLCIQRFMARNKVMSFA